MLRTQPLHHYFSRLFKRDLLAGLTVGVISLPLAMAFAIASGVKPEYGIYTTITAAALVALFGGSRYQVAGPTGAFIPILLSIVLTYGYENLLIAGFLAGILLIIMGLLDMGSLIKFIPRSVTVGFTAGIAVNIFVGQIPAFLGLTGLERHESFAETALDIVAHLQTVNPYSVITALICLAVLLIMPRLFAKVPPSLAGLLLSTAAASYFFPGEVSTINSTFGGIPAALPSLHLPDLTFSKVSQMLQPALTIAILGAIESLLSAVVADGMAGTRHNSNKELIGQGIANLITPLFGGIPATGAIARTATNVRCGAATRYSAVISSCFVLATMLLLAPYAGLIPLASMAPVLMLVAVKMSEYHIFQEILKVRSRSAVVLLSTFFLTILVNLTVAVEIGLLLAMLLFVKRMSEILVVTEVVPDNANNLVGVEDGHDVTDIHHCPQIRILSIEGPLFFGAAQMFSQTLLSALDSSSKVIILRLSKVPLIDITGESHLRGIVETLRQRGLIVLLAGLNGQPERKLKKTGLYECIGTNHIFPHTSQAVTHARQHIDTRCCQTCQEHIFRDCPYSGDQSVAG